MNQPMADNIATKLDTLKGAARDVKDLARDPANREKLIRFYGDIREALDDINASVEMTWRPK